MPTMATIFTEFCFLWEIRAGGQKFLRILRILDKLERERERERIRRFVAGHSPRRHWFYLRFVHVRFVVGKAEQGPVFLTVLRLHTPSIIPPLLHTLASRANLILFIASPVQSQIYNKLKSHCIAQYFSNRFRVQRVGKHHKNMELAVS